MRSSGSKPEVDHDAGGVGFIAQLGSSGSRDVVERALTALERLCHRGGVDADGLSGDGAGILMPTPKYFLRKPHRARLWNLPPPNWDCVVSAGAKFPPIPLCSVLARWLRCH